VTSSIFYVSSFPGGKVEDSDATRSHTALRECEEELGISRDKIEVWAELQEIPDRVNIIFFKESALLVLNSVFPKMEL